MLSSFHFLRPWWLIGLIFIIILFILLLPKLKSNKNLWANHCDSHLLPYITVNESQTNGLLLPILILIMWLVTILALAGPTWSKYIQQTYQKDNARIIILDLSQDMNATDIKPSRIQRANYKILDLLHDIKEGQTGMIVFSSYAFVVSPLTSDSNVIASLVPTLNTSIVPTQGSNITRALNKASQLLNQGGYNHGQILLITSSTPKNTDLATAKKLAEQGYNISVWGIGTQQGAPIMNTRGSYITNNQGDIILAKLNEQALINLANQGQGEYINFTNNNQDLRQALALVNAKQSNSITKKRSQVKTLWRDEGHWLVWLIILIASFIVRRGWLEKIC